MIFENVIKELGLQIAQANACFSTEIVSVDNFKKRQSIGYIDGVSTNHLTPNSLIKFSKNVFSQVGQDGIIEEILNRLNIKKGTFVEFGAWDGVYLSNCRYLALQGWKGLFIEADCKKFGELSANYREYKDIEVANKFVSFSGKDNLDEILKFHKIYEVELLCIDIDGLDYKILENMKVRPKVVLLEGGAAFSPYLNVRIPDEVAKNNLSQPLPVLISIAKDIGYTAVCFFQDLYLVRNDCAKCFYNYNESSIDLYRDFYFALPNFSRDFLIEYVRMKI